MIYTKQAITLEGQINILKQRGLILDDEDETLNVLGHISYFRLAGYWRPLEQDKQRHIFKPNNHFTSDVKALLAKYPMADVRAMGFTANWKAEPLWK